MTTNILLVNACNTLLFKAYLPFNYVDNFVIQIKIFIKQ